MRVCSDGEMLKVSIIQAVLSSPRAAQEEALRRRECSPPMSNKKTINTKNPSQKKMRAPLVNWLNMPTQPSVLFGLAP
ncbi:hypothetical protein X777_01230 [Ooceraea biroi]|uniref:Uncharacterized protein n=1 Tax=Ooceraea biroi TaxID=2015173 RepID=A0A026WQQ2_OOCBI|nr:hypothetical protein X777_01230 [Ooceraea biroi]